MIVHYDGPSCEVAGLGLALYHGANAVSEAQAEALVRAGLVSIAAPKVVVIAQAVEPDALEQEG